MIKKSSFYKKGGFVISAFIIAVFLLPNFSFAWDSHFTHRALTYEVGEFFNYYTDSQLSEKEINWLIQGAEEEDTPPRWINHFYNPITGEGWTGENLGENSAQLVKFLSEFALSSRTALSAKNWAKNRSAQTDYGLYKGDQTWQKAIDAYVDGDKKTAFIALGHILHLLEDMAVPDHTRGDTHAGLAGDKGSPLENWAKEYNKDKVGKLQIAEELYKSGQKPKEFASLENYFDWNAKYSSENFFSEDTIFDGKLNNPNISFKKDIGRLTYVYARFLNDFYPLYVYPTVEKSIDNFTIDDPQILIAYWQRLSKQAVISCAGAIQLFFEEAERQAKLPQKITKKQNATTNTIWSPFGELTKIYNSAVEFAQALFPQSTKADEAVNDEIATSASTPPRNDGEESTPSIHLPIPSEAPATPLNTIDNSLKETVGFPKPYTDISDTKNKDGGNYYVSRVIDGDTITLNSGEDVRLIGMDTPERGEDCFEEAKQKMELMVLGKDVRLEKDKSETDKYNRLLRYIYVDDTLVNAEMLKEGYAHLMIISPDTKYYSVFKSYEEEARFFERGCLFQKDGVGGAGLESEASTYTGWSSAGGSSKPQPQAEENSELQEESEPPLDSPSEGGDESEFENPPNDGDEQEPETPPDDGGELEFEPEPELTPEPETPQDKLLISEIQIDGETASDEFIEIYNPNDHDISLDGWSLQYRGSGSASFKKKNFLSDAKIKKYSFYLIVHKNYSASTTMPADMVQSTISLSGVGGTVFLVRDNIFIINGEENTISDKVAYYNGEKSGDDWLSPETFEIDIAELLEGGSFERKSNASSTSESMIKGGLNQFEGNAYDTDNNKNDFILREASQPQNTNAAQEDPGIQHYFEPEILLDDKNESEPEPEPQEPPKNYLSCESLIYEDHNNTQGQVDYTKRIDLPEIKGTVTLDANTTYYVDDLNGARIPVGAKLIIPEGVVIKFGRWRWGGWMNFPISMHVEGSLEINGSVSNPVIFTTFRDDEHGEAIDISDTSPAPGDWGALQIDSGNGETIKVQNTKFFYAGANEGSGNVRGGAIFIGGEADIDISNVEVAYSRSGFYSRAWPANLPSITDSLFNYNLLWGGAIEKDKAIELVGNTFGCNGLYETPSDTGGLDIEGNPENIFIINNNFTNNKIGLNFYNDDLDIELNAKNNFWNAESGPWHETKNPVGAGEVIQGNVDFDPWTQK